VASDSRDVCGCFNKGVSVNIGCCGVLWVLSSLVCSVFLIMSQAPEDGCTNIRNMFSSK
jgi:hypothetical protein